MERIELPVNSALRTSKRASVDFLSPSMETVTGRSARCLWCDQVVFESQDFHGDFEIGWGASTETYPLDGKLDFYCHVGGQHLAQRRRHKIAFSAGDEVQVFDQGHWWGGWRVVEESEDVGNAIVSLQPDGGPEGEIHRWDISDVRFASKVASNPYSPEGSPYVPPPVTPGTPDEMLDGPNDPYPHGLDMPQINRPIGDEEAEQPAGTVSRRRSRIPVICVDHGHRFRVARIDSDLACHCGSLDIDLDVDGVPAHLAMEGDRPLAHLPHHQPQMGFLPTGPFSVPFTGQEPEATSEDEGDVPYAEGVGPRGSSFRTIVNDIITDNPNVTTAEAQRIARRVMGTYQPGKRGVNRSKTADISPDSLGVKVGDIFYSSWGYDQTNVSFYEVVGLTGASVKVRPIGKNVEHGGGGTTYVTPKPGVFVPWHRSHVPGSWATSWDNEDVNAPMTKRLSPSGAIRINQSERAWLWDGKPKYETAAGWGH